MQIIAAFLIGAVCGILFTSLLVVNGSKEELEPRRKGSKPVKKEKPKGQLRRK